MLPVDIVALHDRDDHEREQVEGPLLGEIDEPGKLSRDVGLATVRLDAQISQRLALEKGVGRPRSWSVTAADRARL
jgi:hypothetical protein